MRGNKEGTFLIYSAYPGFLALFLFSISGILIKVKSTIMNISPTMVQYPAELLNPEDDKTNRNIPTQKLISPR